MRMQRVGSGCHATWASSEFLEQRVECYTSGLEAFTRDIGSKTIGTSWAPRTLEQVPLPRRAMGQWRLDPDPHDAEMPLTVIRF